MCWGVGRGVGEWESVKKCDGVWGDVGKYVWGEVSRECGGS